MCDAAALLIALGAYLLIAGDNENDRLCAVVLCCQRSGAVDSALIPPDAVLVL